MKFENPIMNISMFEVENVVTTASNDNPGGQPTANSATTAVQTFLSEHAPTSGITITF